MAHYIMRLDDASDHMDIQKWSYMEELLDKYKIKPIVGVIPDNKDKSLVSKYGYNQYFWNLVHTWIAKEWTLAMHGYEHRYVSKDGGINPVHKRSEFAGVSYEEQAEKIRKGYQIFRSQGISPEIFFAPSHTFDKKTLQAISAETPIRVISDTVARDIYKDGEFWFIPQQSGLARTLPFKIVTFCYHPNTMNSELYKGLEKFLANNQRNFIPYSNKLLKDRKKDILDKMLQKMYLSRK